MTDDESFSAAKLREYVRGELISKRNEDLYPHTGIVEPGSSTSELLSFIESIYDPDSRDLPSAFGETEVATVLRRRAATEYVGKGISDRPSFAVGLTDREVEVSEAQAFAKIARSLVNQRAPYSGVMFGGMNRGKTNFAGLYLELWRELIALKYGTDGYVVLSNMETLDAVDHRVTELDRFKELVFGDDEYLESGGEKGEPPELDPAIPKWWHFDECSTHLDARSNSWEVSNLYLPLVKRFAKVNLDAMHLGHSGMDIHADLRRSSITTEFIFKSGLQRADVFEDMVDDYGANLKYRLSEIPPTSIEYDPDDYSPWEWE